MCNLLGQVHEYSLDFKKKNVSLFLFFGAGSCYVAQPGLTLSNPGALASERWDYRFVATVVQAVGGAKLRIGGSSLATWSSASQGSVPLQDLSLLSWSEKGDSACFAFQLSEQNAWKLPGPPKRKGRKHKRNLGNRNRKPQSTRLSPRGRRLPPLLGLRNRWYLNKRRTPAPWSPLKVREHA